MKLPNWIFNRSLRPIQFLLQTITKRDLLNRRGRGSWWSTSHDQRVLIVMTMKTILLDPRECYGCYGKFVQSSVKKHIRLCSTISTRKRYVSSHNPEHRLSPTPQCHAAQLLVMALALSSFTRSVRIVHQQPIVTCRGSWQPSFTCKAAFLSMCTFPIKPSHLHTSEQHPLHLHPHSTRNDSTVQQPYQLSSSDTPADYSWRPAGTRQRPPGSRRFHQQPTFRSGAATTTPSNTSA